MLRDTIFRGASMTKPLVAVAALQMAEEGRIQLWEPVATYLPELAQVKVGVEVTAADGARSLELVPQVRPMTIQDLLRHTAGFTYPTFGSTLVHAAYRRADVAAMQQTNADMVRKFSELPLLFQPGSTFEYGMSLDVMGRVLEVVDGRDLDAVLEARILGPLGMRDSGFALPAEKRDRLAEGDPSPLVPRDAIFDPDHQPRWYAGGSGILTTGPDYLRFANALLFGGSFDGVRILSRKSVEHMTSNHLPPGCNYGPFTRALGITAPLPEYGQGFGLGVNVRLEPGRNPNPGSVGDFAWSGVLGTYFWIDPIERLVVILMIQAPEQRVHYRALLRDLVYAALN